MTFPGFPPTLVDPMESVTTISWGDALWVNVSMSMSTHVTLLTSLRRSCCLSCALESPNSQRMDCPLAHAADADLAETRARDRRTQAGVSASVTVVQMFYVLGPRAVMLLTQNLIYTLGKRKPDRSSMVDKVSPTTTIAILPPRQCVSHLPPSRHLSPLAPTHHAPLPMGAPATAA